MATSTNNHQNAWAATLEGLADDLWAPKYAGKTITIRWSDYRAEFLQQVADNDIEWLPAQSDPVIVARAASMYADRFIDWHIQTIGTMSEFGGEEAAVVRKELDDAGLLSGIDHGTGIGTCPECSEFTTDGMYHGVLDDTVCPGCYEANTEAE